MSRPHSSVACAQRERRLAGALAVTLVASLLGGLGAVSLLSPTARAANVSLHLFGSFGGGWSTTSGAETNPGPTILVNQNDHVTVTLTSGDGLDHGLFIDYNNNSVIDFGTDFSGPTTTTTVTFTLDATRAGSFWYYCSIHSGPPYSWNTSVMRGRWIVNALPTATFSAPITGTSWTGGVAHNLVFNLMDEDPPTSLTIWVNYSYNAGTQRGTIAGPMTGSANPNVVSWTPTGFRATDVVINVTARDTRGAYGYSRSAPFEVDSTPPTIVSHSPAPNAVGVTLNSNVRVTWSEAMNETATGAASTFAVQRISDAAWIAGTVSWSPNATQMTFAPTGLWSPTATFAVFVNATAKDHSQPGNGFAGTSWQFTTGSAADTMPPTIANSAATPAIVDVGNAVTIAADVTDNVAVGTVRAHVTGPSTDTNLTLANVGGTRWSVQSTFVNPGAYSFTIWASDTTGNFASSSGSFTVQNLSPPAPTTSPVGSILLGVAVAGIVVVALVTLLVVRRRRKKT